MRNDVSILVSPARIGADAIQVVKGAVSLARMVIHDLVDGDEATETVRLSYRGVDYEVDLSARNAAALDAALAPYLEAARRVPAKRASRRAAARTPARTAGRSSAKSAKSGTAAPNPKDVRSWARSEGIQVSERGRMRADVTRRYQEAHGGQALDA